MSTTNGRVGRGGKKTLKEPKKAMILNKESEVADGSDGEGVDNSAIPRKATE